MAMVRRLLDTTLLRAMGLHHHVVVTEVDTVDVLEATPPIRYDAIPGHCSH